MGDDFRDINQAIKSKNLKQAINELKIDNDLAALLLHYKTHEDFNNNDMEFGKMFKFTFIWRPTECSYDPKEIKEIKDEWEQFIKPEIQPYQLKIRVIENYEADKKALDEISIKKGEIFTFKSRVHKEVWDYEKYDHIYSDYDQYILGIKPNGEFGKFPARCVEVIQENNEENSEPNQVSVNIDSKKVLKESENQPLIGSSPLPEQQASIPINSASMSENAEEQPFLKSCDVLDE